MRKITGIIYLILVVGFLGCKNKKAGAGGPGAGGGQNNTLPVEAVIAKPTTISQSVEVSGSILPNESTEIRPEISGRVVFLNVNEGTVVNKGTLLVKIFDEDLQAELKKLEVQLQIANKTEERQKELLAIGGISQQDYDLSLLQVKNLNADIELLRVNISKTEIRAPYTGRVGLRNISPGAYISPLTLITTISQINRIKIEFSVPEKYSSQVRNGQEVLFTVEGSPENYRANVLATESRIEEDTRNLRIRAVVQGSDKYLVPGTFAKVMIILGVNKDALMVPTQAIIPQARDKQLVLYKSGKAVFAKVNTGVRDSSNIQIIDGISAGDTVVTTGLLFVRPESTLKITKVD